jgi:hypothetical protein
VVCPNCGHLPGYVQVNLGFAHEFAGWGWNGQPVTVRFDVVNVADTVYLIRSGTGIGAFAPQFAPRRGFYMGISQKLGAPEKVADKERKVQSNRRARLASARGPRGYGFSSRADDHAQVQCSPPKSRLLGWASIAAEWRIRARPLDFLLPILRMLPLMVRRTLIEERVLANALPGYTEYMRQVRFVTKVRDGSSPWIRGAPHVAGHCGLRDVESKFRASAFASSPPRAPRCASSSRKGAVASVIAEQFTSSW